MPWPDLLEGVTPAVEDPAAVAIAAARVRNYCHWHIAPSYTETVTRFGSGPWVLDSRRITAVSAIIDADTSASLIPGGTADYDIQGGGVISLRNTYTYPRRRRVAITFTHGYTVCPDDLVDFVRRLADLGSTTAAQRLASATIGQATYRYVSDSDSLFSALDDYRLPSMA